MDLFDQLDQSTQATPTQRQPLADLIRPSQLSEVVGQEHLIGPHKVLSTLISQGNLPSIIFWGPPGSGKTTLARLLAQETHYHFKEFSAVTSGIADIKKVVEEAKARRLAYNQATLVFIDEIHRFNKTQQDAFLPHVESGVFTLIGATTENPSFSIVSALLSRSRVLVLQPLQESDLSQLIDRSLDYLNQQSKSSQAFTIETPARQQLLAYADGDGRRLITALEVASQLAIPQDRRITSDVLSEAVQHKSLLYDKSGEEHYNQISALHKSLRDSDPQGTVYWLGRMLEAGEDPLYLARRLTRAAAEDIGLADPQAIILASAVMEATRNIGMPEASVILAELAIYLALAPKSNAVYQAYNQVQTSINRQPNQPVPLHIRNAPTKLMKQLNYGQGYKYAHDYADAKVEQEHLPDALKGTVFYKPIRGWEADKSDGRRATSYKEKA